MSHGNGAGARLEQLGLALDLALDDLERAAEALRELRALHVPAVRAAAVCERGGATRVARWAGALSAHLPHDVEVVLALRAGPSLAPWELPSLVDDVLHTAGSEAGAVELSAPWAPGANRAAADRRAWRVALEQAAALVRGHRRRLVIGGLRVQEVDRLEGPPPPFLADAHALSLEADAAGADEAAAAVARLRARLSAWAAPAAIWLTVRSEPAGSNGVAPVQALLAAAHAPAERLFWHDDALLRRPDGAPTLLHRLLSDGRLGRYAELLARAPRSPVERAQVEVGRSRRRVVITGGAGFVGANLARRLLEEGHHVTILDDLSRAGVEANAAWLLDTYEGGGAGDGRLGLVAGDVRDPFTTSEALRGCDLVYHLAAQVAVTTSLTHPAVDFEVNALGTCRVLEAARAQPRPPGIVYTSTNKVYGALADVPLVEEATRYAPRDEALRARGIDEARPLDLYSPYGCSKGAADQYVLDYARSYGLRTAVLRLSCIYGPRQFGTADQGWLCQFMLCALVDRPLTIYGDGKQVRDALFVDDLVEAFLRVGDRLDRVSGQAFNVGGGPDNSISPLEVLDAIEALHGRRPAPLTARWRTGDQRYFVADTAKLREATGWRPRVPLREGLARLYEWARASVALRGEPLSGAGRAA